MAMSPRTVNGFPRVEEKIPKKETSEEPTLVQRHNLANNKVKKLRREIDQCRHTWILTGDGFTTRTDTEYEGTERQRTTTSWVQRNERQCTICGLKQEQIKWSPEGGWDSWKSINV